MKQKLKKYFFPAAGVFVSAWLSVVFAFWAIIGFFATEVFMKKYFNTGKIKPLKFSLRDWEIQFHHWLWPGLVIAGAYFLGIINALPLSVVGFVSGIMFQDFYRDKRWHKVIYKKPIGHIQ